MAPRDDRSGRAVRESRASPCRRRARPIEKPLNRAAFRRAMETVGIEPTSADALWTASTSVVGTLVLASRLPYRQGSGRPAALDVLGAPAALAPSKPDF